MIKFDPNLFFNPVSKKNFDPPTSSLNPPPKEKFRPPPPFGQFEHCTAPILCRSFTPKCHTHLRVKDFPKVLTRRLERDLNPRPFGRKATNLPIGHHAPRMCMCEDVRFVQTYNLFNLFLIPITI